MRLIEFLIRFLPFPKSWRGRFAFEGGRGERKYQMEKITRKGSSPPQVLSPIIKSGSNWEDTPFQLFLKVRGTEVVCGEGLSNQPSSGYRNHRHVLVIDRRSWILVPVYASKLHHLRPMREMKRKTVLTSQAREFSRENSILIRKMKNFFFSLLTCAHTNISAKLFFSFY